jgi:Peptidase A4 family/Immunoglobulin domain/Immunoglobulin I-set domain
MSSTNPPAAGASGSRRALRAALAGCLLAGAAASSALSLSHTVAPARPAVFARAATSTPMIRSGGGGRIDGRASRAMIALFTATPARLPAAGGTVRLVASVHGATRCRFSASRRLRKLPVTRRCTSGTVSLVVHVPRNRAAGRRRIRFALHVRGATGRAHATPIAVIERGARGGGLAPRITLQPQSRTVALGSAVVFTAAASGRPTPRVIWQRSTDGGHSWATIAGAVSTSYTVQVTAADGDSEFRAVFRNGAGSATTGAATLSVGTTVVPGKPATTAPVEVAPSLVTQPADISVPAGATATFTAAALGNPTPGVQWQVSSDGGSSWSAIDGATSGSYSLTAQTDDDGEEFRAVFTNSAGAATSSAATLGVLVAPQVTTQPQDQGALAGSGATFTAAASGKPAPTVQWQSSSDGGASWSAIGGANSTALALGSLTISQSGTRYRAVFTNSQGSATTAAATLTVAAAAATPAITAEPSSATVNAGEVASFSAGASGVPTPSVQWQVSTNGGSSWSNVTGASSTTYSFTAASAENGYQYRALFTNSAGSQPTDAATLTVTNFTAPQLTQQPSNQTVTSPGGASFTAKASGSPAPSVQWQVSTNGGSSWSDVSGASSTTLTLASTTTSESGNEYHAVFTNNQGSATSSAATLTVSAPSGTPPQITTQPTEQAVLAGQSATFTAAASGTPTPTVQWQRSTDAGKSWSSIGGATSTSYTISGVSAGEDGYEFRAEFSNTAGTTDSGGAVLAVCESASSSSNWSGYAACGGIFTSVSASWVVPTATCAGTATTYASMWVGIDGESSASVEQDGTDSDCSSGTPTYYAWYEMYPASSSELSPNKYPVQAGDSMTAQVSVSGGTWTLHLNDSTRGWNANETFATPSPAPEQNSAEWIVERPELCNGNNCKLTSLADFGSLTFTGASATLNGTAGSISAAGGFSMNMTSGGTLAAPGALSGGGSSFTDTWFASS